MTAGNVRRRLLAGPACAWQSGSGVAMLASGSKMTRFARLWRFEEKKMALAHIRYRTARRE